MDALDVIFLFLENLFNSVLDCYISAFQRRYQQPGCNLIGGESISAAIYLKLVTQVTPLTVHDALSPCLRKAKLSNAVCATQVFKPLPSLQRTNGKNMRIALNL